MQTALDSNDRQFLVRLNRLGPSTVQELCEDLEVTATAVRQRLRRLSSHGYVKREAVRAARGRPHHRYCLTEEGRRQLGDDYAGLARILWQEIRALDDAEVRRRMMDRLRKALAERYRSTEPEAGQAPVDVGNRVVQLGNALTREGFDVEVEQRRRGDALLPILREHCCPYYEIAQQDATICELEQAVFEDVLGMPVTLTQCSRDGHSCCEFEPVTS